MQGGATSKDNSLHPCPLVLTICMATKTIVPGKQGQHCARQAGTETIKLSSLGVARTRSHQTRAGADIDVKTVDR